MADAPQEQALNARCIVVHHHVRLHDLSGFLGPDVTVNVVRNTEIVEGGAERVPYDEVILELTDEEAVQQLLEAGTVPRSKRSLPHVQAEQLTAMIEEVERVHKQQLSAHPALIEKGKIPFDVAHQRTARMAMVADLLRQLLAMVPGSSQLDAFGRAA